MKKLIIPLNKIRAGDFLQTGSKAFNLARLCRLGFPVPRGFCIKAKAFNNLSTGIKSALDNLNCAAAADKRTVLSDIRQNIINAPLTENLKNQIERHYKLLSAKYVAVRSSATAEDLPKHSFAGQYDTYLNVKNAAECIEAVKKCWASLWTDRAFEYRKNNGIDHLSVNMAVIVQELIEADISGVLFTADPVSGYKSRMVIESVSGLGDKLVSGEAVPTRFRIDKNTFRIIRRSVGDMDERIIINLVKLAKKVEKKIGSPQDIEWAIKNNKIYFLQTRPITVIPPLKPWEDCQVWTNANAGEALPDVVTPISWSIIDVFVKNLFDSFFGWFGFDLKDNPLAGLVAGRPYFNLNTGAGIVKHLPKKLQLRINDINDLFGGEHGDMLRKGLLDIPQEDAADVKFSFIKFISNMPVFIFSFLFYGGENAKSYISRLSAESYYLHSLKIDSMNKDELIKTFSSAVEQCFKFVFKDFVGVIKGFHCYMTLNYLCKRWLKDGTLTGRLLVGTGDMEDAQAGIEMWKLAQEAHKSREVEKIIISGDSWRDIENKLTKNPGSKEFLESWNTFMVRYGHHTRGEAEVFNPRWSEEPDYILKLVGSYINDIERYNPVESQERQKLESQQLFQQCCRELKNPLKRLLFKSLLERAKWSLAFRENCKNQFIRRVAFMRRVLLLLGRELENKGVIKKNNDIFFLKYQEIGPVVQDKADFNVKKIIAGRKAEYEKDKSINPPKVIIGKFDPDNFVPDKENINANAKIFSGLAVSPGVITGRARVILRADMSECVKAGEILVAPFTDPGWTPYFITAAGIVMDLGGLLSHGSIIAREYGIPAVVNVGSATKVIQTGQMLEVDGNKGIVRIL